MEVQMRRFVLVALAQLLLGLEARAAAPAWPARWPVYDHVVVVIEENKDYDEIIGSPAAPYINGVLRREGANLTRMFAEEHHSEGNYFWLVSGDNQGVGFQDAVPSAATHPVYPFTGPSLAGQLAATGRYTFKGYAEDLPAIGSTVATAGTYARKHVPYISFADLPQDANLRFKDFPDPAHFAALPTVAFVIPNLLNDMHDCPGPGTDACIARGDAWLKTSLDPYYQWAKTHNSLLILTFDENEDPIGFHGLTDPAQDPDALGPGAPGNQVQFRRVVQNRIATLFAGAHVQPGDYPEGKGITHVNLLRTLEAMYRLGPAGAQQPAAAAYGIRDDTVVTDVFSPR
jgi:acid phosphatase